MLHINEISVEHALILGRGLANLSEMFDLRGLTRNEDVSKAAIPVAAYVASLNDVKEIGFLGRARQIGWRFVFPTLAPRITADLVEDANAIPRLARVNNGPVAAGLVGAFLTAVELVERSEDVYEMRVLDIPALASATLWLSSPAQDRFVPFLVAANTRPPFAEDKDFVLRIVQMAHDKPRALDENSGHRNKPG